ncbi:MAG TPA: immunoglobulin-like domain-containing protein [Candidatus Paceibacterota bacterium]|nr:immunoglobulin-like domain-containing protein [Candidatus Paceibacterota bacterium]
MSSTKKIISNTSELMLPARKAALLLKCAPDYISKLCREGKLIGKQVEGVWYVDPASISVFEENRVRAKARRSEVLAQQRRLENENFRAANANFLQKALAAVLSFGEAASASDVSTNRKVELIPTRQAAERLSCAADYVSKLCREGKLEGEQIDGQWYVTPESIARFEESRIAAKRQRAEELAKERRLEVASYKKQNGSLFEKVYYYARPLAAGSSVAALAGSLFLVGALVFASTLHPLKENQVASVAKTEVPFFGVEAPGVILPTPSGHAFAGATKFLSNVFAILFAPKQNTPVAVQPVAKPVSVHQTATSTPTVATAPRTSGTTNTVVQNITYPVIERTVEHTTVVSGITSAQLEERLSALQMALQMQIAFLQNPGHESPLQNVVISQVINNLNDVTEHGTTNADSIIAKYIKTNSLDVAGDLTISGTVSLSSFETTNATSSAFAITGLANALLATNADGSVIATTSIGTNLLTGTLATINGFDVPAGGSINISTASSTLLADNNTFSGTNIFSGNTALTTATSTSFAITGLAGALLSTNADGSVANTTVLGPLSFSGNTLSISQANGSTDGYLASSDWNLFNQKVSSSSLFTTVAASYPFQQPGNATSTLVQFDAGLTAYASTTIGNGSAQGGLTVSGNSTTTGNAYFANNVSVGALVLPALANALLSINASGQVVATSSIGADILAGPLGTINGSLLNAGGSITITAASSTLLADNNQFTGGNLFLASTTIGTGTETGGLTVAGGATTTGGMYVGGALTVNGATVSSITGGQLQVLSLPSGASIGQGSVYINPASAGTNNVLVGLAVNGAERARIDAEGDVQIVGTFNSTNTTGTNVLAGHLSVLGNTTLGANASNNIVFNGEAASDLVPNADATYNLGSPTQRFANVYAETLNVTNVVAGGTASSTFVINSDNATNDTEDATLAFSRGIASPNATLKWNSVSKQFEFNNFPVSLTNSLTVSGTATSTIAGTLALTAAPSGAGLAQGSLYINPSSGSTDNTLLGIGVNGIERFRVDAEGDTTIQASLGLQNAIYNISSDTLTVDDKLQINGNILKDSSAATRLTLGSTNVFNGNLSVGAGTITSGLINGQTVSSAANFTGTLAVNGLSTLAGFISAASSTVNGALTVAGQSAFANASTTGLTNSGPTWLTNLTASTLLALDANRQVVSTTTIGTSLLSGLLATINSTPITAGGAFTITAASSTLLANNNTFSGTNTFTGNTALAGATSTSFAITGLTNALLSTNANGSVVATTTLSTTYLSGILATINGTTINAGSSATITAASSTLLADNNTFSGNNSFTGGLGIGKVHTTAGELWATGIIRSDSYIAGAVAGSGDAFWIGDDAKLVDINTANTAALYGQSDATVASLKFGSGGGTISGYAGNIGIGTTTPTTALDVVGDSTGAISVNTPSMDSPTYAAAGAGAFAIRQGSAGTSYSLLFGVDSSAGNSWIQSSLPGSATKPLLLNPIGGNVGIGTTSPWSSNKLTISSSGDFTGMALDNWATGGHSWWLTSTSNANGIGGGKFGLYDNTASAYRMVVDSSGNVGIGNIAPQAKTEITSAASYGGSFGAGRTTSGGLLVSDNSAGGTSVSPVTGLTLASGGKANTSGLGWTFNLLGVNTYYDYSSDTLKRNSTTGGFTDAMGITMSADTYRTGGNRLSFFTGANGDPTERLSITTAGNVGIGTTSPAAQLTVTGGNVTYAGKANVTAIIGLGSTYNNLLIGSTNGNSPFIASEGASPLSLWTNAAERLSITSSGNVGIGTTNPLYKLDIKTDTDQHLFVRAPYSGQDGVTLQSGNDSDNAFKSFTVESSKVILNAATAGNVGIGTTNPLEKLSVVSGNDTGLLFTFDGNNSYKTSLDTNFYGGVGIYNRLTFNVSDGTVSGQATPFRLTGTSTAEVSDGVGFDTGTYGTFGVTRNNTLNGIPSYISMTRAGSVVWSQGIDASNNNFVIGAPPYDGTQRIGSPYFTISTGGNVGIGTTGPTEKLTVLGGVLRVTGATNETGTIALGNDSNGTGYYDTGIFRGAAGSLSNGNYLNLAGYNGIAFNASSNSFGGQATRMYIDGGSGNVGIGNTNPGAKLDVSGSVAVNRNPIYLAGNGDGNHMIGNGLETINGSSDGGTFVEHQFINFKSNIYGGSMLFLNGNNGRVGIGTTTPTEKLSILSGDNTFGTNIFAVRANNLSAGVGIGYNSIRALGTNGNNSLFIDSQNSSGSLVLQNTSGGNVGIGTTNPQSKLSVDGEVRISQGNALKFPYAGESDGNDGKIGAGIFSAGLNIVGSMTDGTTRKVSYYGSLLQQSNDTNMLQGNLVLANNTAYQIKNSGGTAVSVLSVDGSNTTRLYSGGGIVHINPDQSSIATYINYNNGGSVYVGDGSTATNLSVNKGVLSVKAASNGSDTLTVQNTAGTKFLTFKPETATDRATIGYWTGSAWGSIDLGGSLRASAEVQSTNAVAFRAVNGNYGDMLYNDGSNFYFLLTASGDQYGGWNSLRPLTISDTSGDVSLGNGALYVQHGAAVTTSGYLYAGSTLRLNGGDTSNTIWQSTSNAALAITTNGGPVILGSGITADHLHITSSGNVGIGSTSPSATLSVLGATNTAISAYIQGGTMTGNGANGSGIVLAGGPGATGLFTAGGNGGSVSISGGAGGAGVGNGTTGYVLLQATGGNVGIGVTAPQAKLNVLSANNAGVSDLLFTYDASGNYRSGIANNFDGSTLANNKMFFLVSNASATTQATVMTLVGNGNVGIGNTNPQYKLDVSGDINVSSGSCFRVAGTCLYATGAVPAFSVDKNGTDQSVSLSTYTQLTWSHEIFDTNNNFDTGTGRFTPTVPGKYLIRLNVYCGVTGSCYAAIAKNGSALGNIVEQSGSQGNVTIATAVAIVDMNGTTDYIVGDGYSDTSTTISGSAINTNFAGSRLQGADYAEYVDPVPGTAAADYPDGSLICMQGTSPDTYGLCGRAHDDMLIGAVSNYPSYTGNDIQSDVATDLKTQWHQSHILLSMAGRVPMRVSLENGPIKVGDRITQSSVPGVGMKADPLDTSVGRALVDYGTASSTAAGAAGDDQIMVYVDPQQGTPIEAIGDALNATTSAAALAASSTAATFSGALRGAIGGIGSTVVKLFNTAVYATVGVFNKVFAHEIHTDQLCISDDSGETCITRSQLDQLLSGASSASAQNSSSGVGAAGESSASTPPNSGNASSTDTTPPALTVQGDDPAELHVGDVYSDMGVTIVDAGSPNIGYRMSLDGATSTSPAEFQLDTSTAGSHMILYSAIDEAGNTGTATRTVIISE